MYKKMILLLSCIVFLPATFVLVEEVICPQTALAGSGYSIHLVNASPKPGTHLTVGEHVVLNITVEYNLKATDAGRVVLVLQRGDNSWLSLQQKQVAREVSRGSGEATLTDEFDVPAGTQLIRVFVPLVPKGYTRTAGEVVVEYPVKKK